MHRQLSWTSSFVGVLALALGAIALAPAADGDKIKVVIVDGQNNHDWKSTTPFMKKVLEESGRFTVDVATTTQKLSPPPLPKMPDEPKGASDAELAAYKEALAKYADT